MAMIRNVVDDDQVGKQKGSPKFPEVLIRYHHGSIEMDGWGRVGLTVLDHQDANHTDIEIIQVNGSSDLVLTIVDYIQDEYMEKQGSGED